ncbi:MAG TPA: hypothetical protein VJS18_07150 [Paraburkholderia sp.]|nr:hypothetical protein [Paraburkholderia sp.]
MRLTQSALSHHIEALEGFYGMPSFGRKSAPRPVHAGRQASFILCFVARWSNSS